MIIFISCAICLVFLRHFYLQSKMRLVFPILLAAFIYLFIHLFLVPEYLFYSDSSWKLTYFLCYNNNLWPESAVILEFINAYCLWMLELAPSHIPFRVFKWDRDNSVQGQSSISGYRPPAALPFCLSISFSPDKSPSPQVTLCLTLKEFTVLLIWLFINAFLFTIGISLVKTCKSQYQWALISKVSKN